MQGSIRLLIGVLGFTNAAFSTELDGVWEGECSGRHRYVLEFEEDVGTLTSVFEFGSSSCQSVVLEDHTVGHYETTASSEESFSLAWKPERFFRILKAEYMVRIYNSDNYCGFSDWALDEPKELTGIECAGRDHVPSEEPVDASGRLEEDTLYFLSDEHGNPLEWHRRFD